MDGVHEKERWSGAFIPSIAKIQRERLEGLSLSPDAAQYLDKLLIRLLVSLLNPLPKNLQDAQEQVTRKFPESLLSGVLEDTKMKPRERGRKKGHISVDKVHHILKDCASSGLDRQISHFYASILEYMLCDVLKLTANYVQNISRTEIKEQDVKIAMFADKVLVNIFQGDEAEEDVPLLPVANTDENDDVSYPNLVRNLLAEEQRYVRDLQLIMKFFKKAFTDRPSLFTEADIELIFSNIEDLAEMSMKLITMLEEAAEMTDETNPAPLIGNCFEELAEGCSFELYSDYTSNFTDERWDERFCAILQQTSVNAALKALKTEGFRDMVVYVLPNLLVAPIYHGLHYFDQITLLERASSDDDDRESFNQTVSAISAVKVLMEAKANSLPKSRPSEASLRISWKGGVQAEKMKEIEESIENWVGKKITQTCNEFIYEGDLTRITGKRLSARRVFLFDSLLVCCKGRRPMPSMTITHEYRLKEKILLRKTSIVDDEVNELQFTVIEGENRHVFTANTASDKRAWMSHLVRLQYRSIYDRMLDQEMRREAEQQPLRLPSPDVYRFAEPDSPENLVTDQEKPVPSIKGGTVMKLVERLTYQKYYDSGFAKTFLTTFRSFCKPSLLLDLLIERFHIPEPPPTEEQKAAMDCGEIVTRDDLKRFRNEYAQPIQLRVMNVLRQWLEYHWYDFEADPAMLEKVEAFVTSVRGKNMQKWARTMQKIIAKKKDCEEEIPVPLFSEKPPAVEWYLTHEREKYSIMTLHPIEIARQLTLLEFDLYRKVQPSELVGTVWTKAGKEENSPNLLRMIHCSTTVTRWLSKSIVETKNFEERTAVMSRAVEIMQVLKQLNNFNGLLEFVAAFNSSAIHRLNHTKQHLSDRLEKALKECMQLCDPRLTRCLEKLRSCDPPCVPFVGTFLTNILKTEEGNPHLLPNYPEKLELINFAKRRMVASILSDIQQYQNQPYNLLPVAEIREYLTNLQPLKGFTEKQFNDYVFQCSLEIEPRNAERAARFPKTLTDKEIKSPGIVPSKSKAPKNLYRDESRMSVVDRRNSVPDEEPPQSAAQSPGTPLTPVIKDPPPPPCPPRIPKHEPARFSTSKSDHDHVFNFDFPPGAPSTSSSSFASVPPPIEEEDVPPPIPPRDNIPLQFHFVNAEIESFGNAEMIFLHQPMFHNNHSPQPQMDGLSFNHFDNSYPPTESSLSNFQPGFSQVPDLNNRAPPVPPRDVIHLFDAPPAPPRDAIHLLPRDATHLSDAPPAIPPRDPPATSTPSYDFYALRYVPDPTRSSKSSSDIPPPIPRR